jgi:hypothetical protein
VEGLKQYVPILPSVRKDFSESIRNWYAMKPVGGGVYVITDKHRAQCSRSVSLN